MLLVIFRDWLVLLSIMLVRATQIVVCVKYSVLLLLSSVSWCGCTTV